MYFTHKDGTQIAYDFYPNMSPGVKTLIIIHGWGGPQIWTNYVNTFAKQGFQLIVVHLPGFGDSKLPKNYKKLDSYKYAEYVAELLKDLGLEDSIILGHSLGGKIAVILNAKYGIGSKLILVACACFHRMYPGLWIKTQIVKIAKWILSRTKFTKKLLQNKKLLKLVASDDYFNADLQLREVLKHVVNDDVRDLMPKVKAKTLIIWGEKDNITPLIDGVCANRFIKHSHIKIIKNVGHFPFVTFPDLFHNLIIEFINEKSKK